MRFSFAQRVSNEEGGGRLPVEIRRPIRPDWDSWPMSASPCAIDVSSPPVAIRSGAEAPVEQRADRRDQRRAAGQEDAVDGLGRRSSPGPAPGIHRGFDADQDRRRSTARNRRGAPRHSLSTPPPAKWNSACSLSDSARLRLADGVIEREALLMLDQRDHASDRFGVGRRRAASGGSRRASGGCASARAATSRRNRRNSRPESRAACRTSDTCLPLPSSGRTRRSTIR
jgi:hypothetical protein